MKFKVGGKGEKTKIYGWRNSKVIGRIRDNIRATINPFIPVLYASTEIIGTNASKVNKGE